MKIPVYILILKTGKPLLAVYGGYEAFNSISEAKRAIKEMQEAGTMHVYGKDTFYTKDLRVKKIS